MELRSYAAIVWRRIWIIALVVGVVALYASYQYYSLLKTPGALKAYQSNIILRIGLQATPGSTDQFYSDYQTTSESLADEFVTGPILTSKEFCTQIMRQIQIDTQNNAASADLGPWQDTQAIGKALSATRIHSLVTVSVTWSTAAGARAIAAAVGEVSITQISNYLDYEVRSTPTFSQNIHPPATAKIISSATEPVVVAGPSGNRPLLLLVLLFVALIIGIALAFLVEYLDDRIRSREELVQLLQLPVYGEIPPVPRQISQQISRQRQSRK
ncbi:MAG: hypothetical protein IMW89_09120 [Ktedonobacteraceae bacterium]|nr:hypothetical protein [Ktedonobacteraceae bacterium]